MQFQRIHTHWIICLFLMIPTIGWAQDAVRLDAPLGITIPRMPLTQALAQVEEATEWRFSYNPSELPTRLQVSSTSPQSSLRTLLDQWLSGTGLSYRQIGSQIVIFRPAGGSSVDADSRTKIPLPQLSGYVVDSESGERLPYAKVWDARSGRGTVANAYGFFILTLPRDTATLVANSPTT